MKKALATFLLIVILCICLVFVIIGTNPAVAPDVAELNDAVTSAMATGDRNEAVRMLADSVSRQYEETQAAARSRDLRLQAALTSLLGAAGLTGVCFFMYCQRRVLAPFRKLKGFARDIAAGNLDVPLEMDRHGSFGAFTESFDLMREELKTARENERAANRSKKELVASLSHDIKTPVASIKATAELMMVTAGSEKEKAQLASINAKAEQINALITDMFHATLEELQALTVTPSEHHSAVVGEMIKSADYDRKVRPFQIPGCIIIADSVRLQQVFDNIIANANKYAGTDLEVNAFFDGSYLAVELLDFGGGVEENELPLLTSKYYRGKNAEGKSGYGLGLFISKRIMEQMSGGLEFENRPDGFTARLMIRLA